jgi:hypothetical protein
LTPPEQKAEGIQMFAVCSKKESKTDAPGLKEVRDKVVRKEVWRQGQSLSCRSAAASDDRVQINVAAVCGESVCTSAAML